MEQQLAEARQALIKATGQPATNLDEVKASYEVPEGEGHLVHALVTKLNSVTLPTPQVQAFHPSVYRTLSKDPSFAADVVHEPKKHGK